MLNFLLRRTLRVILILVSVELLVFLLVHAIPGSPWDSPTNQARALGSIFVDPITLERRSQYFGFDLPLWRQFTRYLIGDIRAEDGFVCGVICGNLGPSARQIGRSVQDVLFQPAEGRGAWESRAGYTFRLVIYAFGIVAGLGVPLGVISALRAKSRFDRVISATLTSLASIPVFVLGLLGIFVFASGLKWIKVLPDWSEPRYWILPTVLLAVVPLTNMMKITRASILHALGDEYIRTARAKGLTRSQTIWKHVLPNGLISILTYLLPIFVELLAASFIIEGIFGFPGFGREYWDSIGDLDYAMIMGITLIYAFSISVVNLLLELVERAIDPRLRLS